MRRGVMYLPYEAKARERLQKELIREGRECAGNLQGLADARAGKAVDNRGAGL
jgi:hypothetical protein